MVAFVTSKRRSRRLNPADKFSDDVGNMLVEFVRSLEHRVMTDMLHRDCLEIRLDLPDRLNI